ncbi:ThuA domain-containing protein [Alteromonas gilva]|uniref:ThuA domain-containing protein n=1 Tax=Alteromonas gilva TaxID=2987522 RepID=A0ABT5KY43_9ALTE|nr:ThuA domain-containing protein [Alteromonas gilva]MDC8829692.1 ThuA domain-containing protein [Alteromonas gilva]
MKTFKALSNIAVTTLLVSGSFFCNNLFAQDKPITNCALRNAPFSVSLPAYDIMTRPAARELTEQYYPGLFATLPAWLLSDTVPSLATILTLEQLIARMDPAKPGIDKLDAALKKLPVTTDDQTARCARFDAEPQLFTVGNEPVQVLVFQKINGYDHGRSVTAATEAFKRLAKDMGYGVTVTAHGGAFVASNLAQFDVVVWNNVSGDTLTLSQRKAFEDYMHNGGGFLGVHASGGDSVYYWDWYRDSLLGAQFIGHPMEPQFQTAELTTHINDGRVGASLPQTWSLKDEWYSFASEPQIDNVEYVLSIDESSYTPGNLAMGDTHPIAWKHCVRQGRAMYTAIGHREEVYANKENMQLLKDALQWTAGQGVAQCKE